MMNERQNEAVQKACGKLIELKDLNRQNFAPAPEMYRIYNDCIDTLIDAGLAADHYKVNSKVEPLELLGRLEAVLRDFCGLPESGESP
jgi:hypothetical protein